MPTTYAGNSANFPTSITIPSDGDGPGIKAADVNAGFEGLADRTAKNQARIITLEARRQLVDYARVTGLDLGISLAHGGTVAQTVNPIVSASVATVVGDIVEVELSVRAQLTQGAAATVAASFSTLLRWQQNGGSDNDVLGSNRMLSFKPRTASLDTLVTNIHVFGSMVIATAGTLTVNSPWSLGVPPGAEGCSATATYYACVMRIWRS